jgi:hypothetical protein
MKTTTEQDNKTGWPSPLNSDVNKGFLPSFEAAVMVLLWFEGIFFLKLVPFLPAYLIT